MANKLERFPSPLSPISFSPKGSPKGRSPVTSPSNLASISEDSTPEELSLVQTAAMLKTLFAQIQQDPTALTLKETKLELDNLLARFNELSINIQGDSTVKKVTSFISGGQDPVSSIFEGFPEGNSDL